MKSKRTKQFRALFAELPESVQRQANEAYRLFQVNPSHPRLSCDTPHPVERDGLLSTESTLAMFPEKPHDR
jgi:hypothetical protein